MAPTSKGIHFTLSPSSLTFPSAEKSMKNSSFHSLSKEALPWSRRLDSDEGNKVFPQHTAEFMAHVGHNTWQPRWKGARRDVVSACKKRSGFVRYVVEKITAYWAAKFRYSNGSNASGNWKLRRGLRLTLRRSLRRQKSAHRSIVATSARQC